MLNSVTTTSFYYPQSNVKVEHFTDSWDMLAKLSERENENWDLVLNQALVAARFSINDK